MNISSKAWQNPFIPNTISHKLFTMMQTGQKYTIPKLQQVFNAQADLITYILKRDHWLYQHDAVTKTSKKQTAGITKDRKKVAANQIGLLKNGGTKTRKRGSTFTKKTQFWLRDASDISVERYQRQLKNTEAWVNHNPSFSETIKKI